jgi:hypothetical protein
MTTHTSIGPFRLHTNQMLPVHSRISLLMHAHSLALPSAPFKQTMAPSSSTLMLILYSPRMALTSAYRVHMRLSKTARPKELYAPSTTLSAPLCFMPIFPRSSGLKLSPRLPTFSTGVLAKQLRLRFPILASMVVLLAMTTLGSSAAFVTLTCHQRRNISSALVLLLVSFLDILPTTEGIAAIIQQTAN